MSLRRVLGGSAIAAPLAVLFHVGVAEAQVVPVEQPAASPTPAAGAPQAKPPPGAESACEAKCCAHDEEECHHHTKVLERTGYFGLRGTTMRVSGTDGDATTTGLLFAGGSEQYGTAGLFPKRFSAEYSLGGGSGNLEGALGGGMAFGVRAPVGPDHGPVLRLGWMGALQGNSKYYFSHLELPLGEAGWQYIDGTTVLEIGGRAAPVLTGRYDPGDTGRRELSGWEWGGYMAAHALFGRIDVQALRIQTNDVLASPVDTVHANACGYAFDLLEICGDVTWMGGDATFLGPMSTSYVGRATTTYAGLSVGLLGF